MHCSLLPCGYTAECVCVVRYGVRRESSDTFSGHTSRTRVLMAQCVLVPDPNRKLYKYVGSVSVMAFTLPHAPSLENPFGCIRFVWLH